MINFERHLALSHDPAVQHCLAVAKKIHAKDRRIITGNPYIVHCEAVGLVLQRLQFSVDNICAGLLHDTVEEHPKALSFDELEELILCEAIDRKQAARIVKLVRSVTIDPEWPKKDAYEYYCDALAQHPEAIPIAIADRFDNTRDLHQNLRSGYDAFGPKMLNCKPHEMMVDIYRVLTSCVFLCEVKDRRRVGLLSKEIGRFVSEILALVEAKKIPRR